MEWGWEAVTDWLAYIAREETLASFPPEESAVLNSPLNKGIAKTIKLQTVNTGFVYFLANL
jgi:hypothetical protein